MSKSKNINIIKDVVSLMCYSQIDNPSIIKFSECKYSTKKHPMVFSAAIKNIERVAVLKPEKCRNVQFENDVLMLEGDFQIHVKGEAMPTTTSKRNYIEVK